MCQAPWGKEALDGLPIRSLRCRHLERFPLQTRYIDIVEGVKTRLRALPQDHYLAVDATGVGRGVVEQLAVLNPLRVTITNGLEAQQGESKADWRVPKRDLVGAAQIALQNRVLEISRKLPLAEVLVRELLNFRVKISDTGHDSYNAWRESEHDDLVLGLAIAAWAAELIIVLKGQLRLGEIQAAIQREQVERLIEKHRISPI